MQIGHNPIVANQNLPSSFHASKDRNSAEIRYLNKHLAPEDIIFFNFRGINGQPMLDTWCTDSFLAYLYKNSTDRTAFAARPDYYSNDVAQGHDSAIDSMKFMLQQPYLDARAKANLKQSIQDLQIARETQNARYGDQLTWVLENAKAAFVHRGIAQEWQVAETIEVIDAVLRNIETFSALIGLGHLHVMPDAARPGCHAET